jgi:hypothetical protein
MSRHMLKRIWIDLAQERGRRRALLNTTTNLRAPYNVRKSLRSCATDGFSRRIQIHGVTITDRVSSLTFIQIMFYNPVRTSPKTFRVNYNHKPVSAVQGNNTYYGICVCVCVCVCVYTHTHTYDDRDPWQKDILCLWTCLVWPWLLTRDGRTPSRQRGRLKQNCPDKYYAILSWVPERD